MQAFQSSLFVVRHMKIRSITCFATVSDRLAGAELARVSRAAERGRGLASEYSFEVQSTRLAVQPISDILDRRPAREFAQAYDRLLKELGFDYGALLIDQEALYEAAVPIVLGAENLFVSLRIASRAQGVDFRAIQAAARVIHGIGHGTADGLGNFRFAAAANVPPGVPFFPTAYADQGTPSFAFATQAADLAVNAFTDASNLDQAQTRLVDAVQTGAAQLRKFGEQLALETGVAFAGIDFSLAPAPDEATSLATALERLTGARFGTRGTLFAASFVTDALRAALQQGDVKRAGFSGLMLPMLEDWTMGRRSEENLYSLDSLLLYSTVCGTGLDTIPLAGDTTVEQIAALLLDLAALAVKLDKPLTARLVPVPNLKAGEMTPFDFPFFTNARAFRVNSDRELRVFDKIKNRDQD